MIHSLCVCVRTCGFLAKCKRYCSTVLSPSLPNETSPRHHYKSSIYAIRKLGLQLQQWYQNETAKIMSQLTSLGRATIFFA